MRYGPQRGECENLLDRMDGRMNQIDVIGEGPLGGRLTGRRW